VARNKLSLITTLTSFFIILSSLIGVAKATTITYKYDALGRLTLVSDGIVEDRIYNYDDAGNRTSVVVESEPALDPFEGVNMQCFVDTPAYDNYTPNFCMNFSSATRTTAIFKVANLPLSSSEYSLSWQTSSCSGTTATSTCSKSIRSLQQITITAVLMHSNSGKTKTLSATAIYEGGPGGLR